MTDPQQHAPAPPPPAAAPYGTGAAAGSAPAPAQGYPTPAPGSGPTPGYPTPGYPVAPGADVRPRAAAGSVTLALVFAGIAVIAGWGSTLASVMSYRLDLPIWAFSLVGGLITTVFDVLALVFGIIAARRGGGVRAGIAIGIGIVGLLGELFSMMMPALYTLLARF